MLNELKQLAKILSYIICIFFATQNSYINNTVDTIQQTATDDENLHLNKKKIATLKEEKLFALVVASTFN